MGTRVHPCHVSRPLTSSLPLFSFHSKISPRTTALILYKSICSDRSVGLGKLVLKSFPFGNFFVSALYATTLSDCAALGDRHASRIIRFITYDPFLSFSSLLFVYPFICYFIYIFPIWTHEARTLPAELSP